MQYIKELLHPSTWYQTRLGFLLSHSSRLLDPLSSRHPHQPPPPLGGSSFPPGDGHISSRGRVPPSPALPRARARTSQPAASSSQSPPPLRPHPAQPRSAPTGRVCRRRARPSPPSWRTAARPALPSPAQPRDPPPQPHRIRVQRRRQSCCDQHACRWSRRAPAPRPAPQPRAPRSSAAADEPGAAGGVRGAPTSAAVAGSPRLLTAIDLRISAAGAPIRAPQQAGLTCVARRGRSGSRHATRPLLATAGHARRPLLRAPPSSPVPATSSPTWIPCAPLPCVGIFSRAAPCHRASHLLIARADAPAAPPTSSFSRRRCRQHPLPGQAQAPARLDTPRRPPPSSPSLDLSLSRPSRPDPRCCDLSGSIRRPFGWIVSSRLDLSLPWPSRPDLSFPLLFCRGRGHHDRRRRVRCCRPPWRGSLTPRRSKKQEGRPAGALLLCRPADR
jgi:hypothetical protein